jgi:hypothetical protein
MRGPVAGIVWEGQVPRRLKDERCGRPWHLPPGAGAGRSCTGGGCPFGMALTERDSLRPARRLRISLPNLMHPRVSVGGAQITEYGAAYGVAARTAAALGTTGSAPGHA